MREKRENRTEGSVVCRKTQKNCRKTCTKVSVSRFFAEPIDISASANAKENILKIYLPAVIGRRTSVNESRQHECYKDAGRHRRVFHFVRSYFRTPRREIYARRKGRASLRAEPKRLTRSLKVRWFVVCKLLSQSGDRHRIYIVEILVPSLSPPRASMNAFGRF